MITALAPSKQPEMDGFFSFKFLKDISTFRGVTYTPVLDFWWRVSCVNFFFNFTRWPIVRQHYIIWYYVSSRSTLTISSYPWRNVLIFNSYFCTLNEQDSCSGCNFLNPHIFKFSPEFKFMSLADQPIIRSPQKAWGLLRSQENHKILKKTPQKSQENNTKVQKIHKKHNNIQQKSHKSLKIPQNPTKSLKKPTKTTKLQKKNAKSPRKSCKSPEKPLQHAKKTPQNPILYHIAGR